MTTKSTFTGSRLLRQIEQAKFDHKEYGVRVLRQRSYYDIKHIMMDYFVPDRANFYSRSWKHNRRTQYKSK